MAETGPVRVHSRPRAHAAPGDGDPGPASLPSPAPCRSAPCRADVRPVSPDLHGLPPVSPPEFPARMTGLIASIRSIYPDSGKHLFIHILIIVHV